MIPHLEKVYDANLFIIKLQLDFVKNKKNTE